MMILWGILSVIGTLGIVLARRLTSIAPIKVWLIVSIPLFFVSFTLFLVYMTGGDMSDLGVMALVSAVTTLSLLLRGHIVRRK